MPASSCRLSLSFNLRSSASILLSDESRRISSGLSLQASTESLSETFWPFILQRWGCDTIEWARGAPGLIERGEQGVTECFEGSTCGGKHLGDPFKIGEDRISGRSELVKRSGWVPNEKSTGGWAMRVGNGLLALGARAGAGGGCRRGRCAGDRPYSSWLRVGYGKRRGGRPAPTSVVGLWRWSRFSETWELGCMLGEGLEVFLDDPWCFVDFLFIIGRRSARPRLK